MLVFTAKTQKKLDFLGFKTQEKKTLDFDEYFKHTVNKVPLLAQSAGDEKMNT
jgi:hypothetical protein